MRRLSIIAWMSAAVLLTACSGGSRTIIGTPTSTGTGTGTVTVSTVSVAASSATIAADGSTTSTISAIAKDSNNVLVGGATITFTTTAGDLTVTQATTDATGLAEATIAAGSAPAGTAITVTAADGTVKGSTKVTVSSTQETITLTTSLPQILSDGSQTATLTALVKDANNNVVPGVTVAFTATSGALVVTKATTDATGSALATLSPGGDPSNRTITVTATAGGATTTIGVPVTGTTLSVSGSPTLVLNGTGTYTVAVANSAKTGISNTAVALVSSLGNTLTPASVTTASTGQASFTVTATKSGTDTVTATALGQTATVSIAVSAQNFAFTTPSSSATTTNVDLGSNQTLSVVWTVNGAAQVGQVITFAATRGTLSSTTATTDAAGTATVTISSSVAGPATVSASTAATASSSGITAQTSLEFISITPVSIDLQASPATIAAQGQSTLTAVVRDANNNLVEGQVVTFATVNDTTGGTLSVPSAITNAQGRAQAVYTASTTTSSTNGVVVRATVQSNQSVTTTADLTVGGLSVGLSLGTGNTITQLPANCGSAGNLCTEFEVSYAVVATDSAGNAVPNVAITLTVHALDYMKGTYTGGGTAPWVQSIAAICPNEDASQLLAVPADVYDGVLEAGEDGCQANTTLNLATLYSYNPATPPAAPNTPNIYPAVCNPDGNRNGKLDPGVTAVVSPGTVTTDSTGTGVFNVIYPQSIANWVTVQLIATATVSGTETNASVTFSLPILSADVVATPTPPPGYPSPYGVASSCSIPN
jgi:hypothetical protein